MSEQALEEAVIKTLQYFSLFHYPLTAEELFRYLWQAPVGSYAEFGAWLEKYQGSRFVHSGAFYHLPGRGADVSVREAAVAYTEQKTRVAMRGARLIRWVPFLRGVFVCNSVAMNVASSESDIDLFIVTENGRTWLVRMLVTLILSVFRLRRHGDAIADRLCLSFYSDTNHLDMRGVALGADDVYLAYWVVQLVPVWDPYNLEHDIVRRNTWMHGLVPNAVSKNQESEKSKNQTIDERLLGGRIGAWGEKFAKWVQLRHIAKTSAGKNRPMKSAVVIEDGFLKFHETDRREEFRDRWKKQLNTITLYQ